MIIFLNGASSSGKTNIAKALQHLSDVPLLLLGIDTMINMMPIKYWAGGERANEGFNFIPGEDEYGIIQLLQTGEFGYKVIDASVEIASLLSKKGFSLIIDEVLLNDESLKKYQQALAQFTVYFVGVHCERKTLEEREILRGDRCIGSARDQMKRCHSGVRNYDLEVDTTYHSAFQCAQEILNFIAREPQPKGFVV